MSVVLELARRRALAFVLAMIGAALFFVFIIRTEDTRQDQGELRERVVRVEAKTPCVELTTRECALKLLAALSPEDRREFLSRDVRREVAREIERTQRGRIRERVERAEPNAEGTRTAPVTPSPSSGGEAESVPGISPEGEISPDTDSPSTEGGDSGSGGPQGPSSGPSSEREPDPSASVQPAPGVSDSPAPEAPQPTPSTPGKPGLPIDLDEDNPLIDLPDVDVPPVGPIDLPPIKVPSIPCIETVVTKC